MQNESLRQMIRRQPFVPFLLRMNDGRVFHFPHPGYIALSRRAVIVIDPVTEETLFLEPVLIASVEPAATPSQPNSENPSGGNP